MQLYLARNNVKSGPFTRYQVIELLSDGTFTEEDLGWHEGLDTWMPLKEIPAVAAILEDYQAPEKAVTGRAAPSLSPEGALEELGCTQVRPFVRFFARWLDLAVFWVLCWAVLGGYDIPEPLAPGESLDEMLEAMQPFAFITLAIVFAWNFVEAYLLSSFGTTLGKYVFRIEVRNGGGARLSYGQALRRTLHVWVAGLGLGVAFLREALEIIALFNLVNTGRTSWDRSQNLQVQHRRIGEGRIAVAVLIFLAVFFGMNLVFNVPA